VPRRRTAPERLELGSSGALEQWFSAAPLALAIVDRRRHVVRCNAALTSLAGLSGEDAVGRRIEEVLPAVAPLLDRTLDHGATIASEEVAGTTRTDGGRPPRMLAACFPLRGEDDAVAAAGLVLSELPDGDRVRVGADRMAMAMDGTGTGFWDWDAVGDRFSWSESLARLHGVEPAQSPGDIAGFLGLIHPEDRQAQERALREAIERGEDYAEEFRVVLPDGTERWIACRGHLIAGDDGRPAGIVGLMADVTERRRREDALTFLAEAGDALAGLLDPLQTMDEIARLAVPRLADWCAVQLASDEQGGFRNVAVAHVDPEKVRWARALEDRYPPDADAPTGAPAVIRSGRSELYPEIDEELLKAGAKDEEHLEIIRALRINSAMVVPMRARDRTLGAMTFIFAESGRQYSTHELELAEELGRRAGLALDHARLYDREHRTAETLQRALLPPTLPQIDGHELAARYLPGRVGDHVGGDWYDAFTLPDGRIGIAIGDIGGRGIGAAALMGQMRNALRAYALRAPDPGVALGDLRLLDEALPELVFATLTYIVYEPETGRGVFANAGHLPPLVLDAEHGGSFLPFPACPPLGAGGEAPCAEHSFVLSPGATLVLYTDGLVESRQQSIDVGLAKLAAVAEASTGDVQRLADDIVGGFPDQRDDDIALLALRRRAD
jgi:PAS domain S-box-containing protein